LSVSLGSVSESDDVEASLKVKHDRHPEEKNIQKIDTHVGGGELGRHFEGDVQPGLLRGQLPSLVIDRDGDDSGGDGDGDEDRSEGGTIMGMSFSRYGDRNFGVQRPGNPPCCPHRYRRRGSGRRPYSRHILTAEGG
jgi:hypothetical protein